MGQLARRFEEIDKTMNEEEEQNESNELGKNLAPV